MRPHIEQCASSRRLGAGVDLRIPSVDTGTQTEPRNPGVLTGPEGSEARLQVIISTPYIHQQGVGPDVVLPRQACSGGATVGRRATQQIRNGIAEKDAVGHLRLRGILFGIDADRAIDDGDVLNRRRGGYAEDAAGRTVCQDHVPQHAVGPLILVKGKGISLRRADHGGIGGALYGDRLGSIDDFLLVDSGPHHDDIPVEGPVNRRLDGGEGLRSRQSYVLIISPLGHMKDQRALSPARLGRSAIRPEIDEVAVRHPFGPTGVPHTSGVQTGVKLNLSVVHPLLLIGIPSSRERS